MSIADRYGELISRYSKVVIVVVLVATLLVGSAATNVDGGLSIAQFGSNSKEAQKLDYVQSNFSTEGENTTVVQVVTRGRGENVLSKESLVRSLELQRSIRDDESVDGTLRADQPTVGLANLVAIAAIYRERAGGPGGPGGSGGSGGSGGPGGSDGSGGSGDPGSGGSGGPPAGSGAGGSPETARLPTLDEQIDQLESMSPAEVEDTVAYVLDPDRETSAAFPVDPYSFLPTDYEPGSTEADARVTFVFQSTDPDASELSDEVVAGQTAIEHLAQDRLGRDSALVFGAGIVDAEATSATGDSFAVLSPIAFLLVLLTLAIAYRDPVDVGLGLAGILLVLVWMAGFMGWVGIGVTQIIIAVPFLLIGLSIDYALHVVMRYREAMTEAAESGDDAGTDPRSAMRRGLAGVVVAIGAATFTTAVGFFSNTISPITSIQQFGLVSGVGIVAGFVVFGALLPAVKIEVERLLRWIGFAREQRAFGTGRGPINRVLQTGAVLARKAPVVVLVAALLVSAGGAYGATKVDTSLDQVDFLPHDSPAWMEQLPGPFAPSDYEIRESAIYLNDNFLQDRDRTRVEILTEGDVTDPGTLDRLQAGRDRIADSDTALTLADGEPRVQDPITVIERTAAQNRTVATLVERHDTDDDGLPEENLKAVYDAVYAANPEEAKSVFYREDGEYRAVRSTVTVKGGSDTADVTREMRDVAATIRGDSDLTVTATGRPIINEIVQSSLLRTLVETFLVTLLVILAFLTAIFYTRYRTLSLGAVTMVPVVFALAWILGTMYLLGIPFTTETAIIASIAIGLGVDYTIHVSERFVDELAEGKPTGEALRATLAGTGGALLASAVTTTVGFGSLALALVPSLQRFGLVTGVTIVYAFFASVVVLPSLLALWRRYVATDVGSVEGDPAASAATGEVSD